MGMGDGHEKAQEAQKVMRGLPTKMHRRRRMGRGIGHEKAQKAQRVRRGLATKKHRRRRMGRGRFGKTIRAIPFWRANSSTTNLH